MSVPHLLLLSYYIHFLLKTLASCSAEQVRRIHSHSGVEESRVGYMLISRDIFALVVEMAEFKEVMPSWWHDLGHLQKANVDQDFFGEGLLSILGTWSQHTWAAAQVHTILQLNLPEMRNVKSWSEL